METRTIQKYGWLPDLPDHRDLQFSEKFTAQAALPASVDLSPKMPPVYDQGQLGSCFSGDTLVPLLHGVERTLKELAEGIEGENFWIYSVEPDSGKFIPALASAKLTRKNAETISVYLDNGKVIQCTKDHEFLTKEGIYIKAEKLQIGQSLMPLKRMLSEKGYELIWDNVNNKYNYTHWKVKMHFENRQNHDVIHHIDFNKKNNSPDNLQLMTWKAHRDLHASLANFDTWNGTEKQKEHSRQLALKMHSENPGWNLNGCSKGGTTNWELAQNNPEKKEKILKNLSVGRTDKIARTKATNKLKETLSKPENKEKMSKSSKERYHSNKHIQETCKNNGKKIGGKLSNEFQCAKFGSEVLFKLQNLNEHNWNEIRDTYTEIKNYSRTRNGKVQNFVSNYNSVPKYEKAIEIFGSEENLLLASQNYNCKVVKIEDSKNTDVYCLTVPTTQNFALSAGVYVHNCTANSIGAAFEYDLMQQKLPSFTPSRLFIYYNERSVEGTIKSDSGAMIRDGIKVVNKLGACKETTWTYDISKFAKKPSTAAFKEAMSHLGVKYYSVKQTEFDIKTALASGFPVVFGFTVYESFESATVAKTGIVNMPAKTEKSLGGHAVLIVGYDDAKRQFRVRNSWGPSWGLKGYFLMPYDYVVNPNLASDFWVLQQISG